MSPACAQAMRLPEIVAAILEEVHGARDLFAALRVNKLWTDEATTILWHVDPPIRALVCIEDAGRLQYYPNKVTTLRSTSFDFDETYEQFPYHKLLSLRLPRLIQFSTDRWAHSWLWFLQYLRPNLKTFICRDRIMSDDQLMMLKELCPTLQNVWLENWPGTIPHKVCSDS